MPVANQLVPFLRRTVYQLKKDYGRPLDIYQIMTSVSDLATGKKVQTRQKFHIHRGVVLPSVLARKFAYDQAYLRSARSFTYGAIYDVDTTSVLLDARDLPKGFEFQIEYMYIVFNKKRFEIVKAEYIEEATAFSVNMKETTGTISEEILCLKVVSAFKIVQNVAGNT